MDYPDSKNLTLNNVLSTFYLYKNTAKIKPQQELVVA